MLVVSQVSWLKRKKLTGSGSRYLSDKIMTLQWNPVKKILKIPRKSYFLSGKFLKRVILMKWENFGAFLSWFLRQEIFLTGFFLSEFHCICIILRPSKEVSYMVGMMVLEPFCHLSAVL
jgi:hypothetical protein